MALVYIDAWGIKNGPHGISRYCRSLLPRLVAAAPQHEFVVLRPRRRTVADRLVGPAAAREVEIPLPETDWATVVFRPFLEPVFRRHGRPDVYHSLFHMLPLAFRRGRQAPRQVVVTLHDLICLDLASETKRSGLARAWATRFDRTVIPYALRHADHVICISEATRRRATEWVPPEKSTTIHHGVDDAFLESDSAVDPDLPLAGQLRPPYVAALGTARPYKNLSCVVRAVSIAKQSRPDLRLVLIGGDGAVPDAIRRQLGTDLIITPRVSDDDLRAIVRKASVFVVASRAEGFGLPLLEAMAIGTPVAASDIATLREVGGDVPLWFDPDRPDDLARAILRMATDGALRAERIAEGRMHAAGFNWSRTADSTVAVYDRVLAGVGATVAACSQ